MQQIGRFASAEQIEIVSDDDRLAEIGPAWDELWRDVDAFIFQSHAWISGWWQIAPERELRQLRIGLVWESGRLVAVMPLCITRRRGLRFLEWAANSHSDYEDILARPGFSPAAQARLWTQLAAAGGFDIALLNRLRPDARARLLMGSTKRARLVTNHRSEVSYRVTGDWTSGAAWFASQPKKSRKNYRYRHNVLADVGTAQFRLLGSEEPLGPVLERFSLLKREWLAARGHKLGLFEDGGRMLAALVDALAREGLLRIFAIEVDGLIVAISVNFVQHGVMMAFVTTYDPKFEKASTGALLMSDYIMWSFDNGLSTVDFLCGAEAFKSSLATASLTLTTLAAPGSLRGHIALLLDGALHTFKQWRAARVHKAPVKDGALAHAEAVVSDR